jgi:hypothetical protein
MPAPKDPKKYIEWKKKLSKAGMGRLAWDKGQTKETNKSLKRISEKLKGRITWMKGKKHTKKAIEENRRKHLDKKASIETRKKMSDSRKRWLKTHEISEQTRKKIGLKHKDKVVSEVTKEKLRKYKGKKHHAYKKPRPTEIRKKISQTLMGHTFLDETKEKISNTKIMNEDSVGPKNPAWLGGISFEPYDYRFNPRFKNLIKNKYRLKCYICKKPASCIHHINYNKKDTTEKNSVLLCRSCHGKTNHERDYWFAFFCYNLDIEPEEML